MRLPTRPHTGVAEGTGSTRPELFDALPTRSGTPVADESAGGAWLAARLIGALAVLATGAVHLYEFDRFYSQTPTIGTLFFLNFLGATAIGLGLLAPVERIAGRYGSTLLLALVLAGIAIAIAIAATAFAFLLISEQTPLFGFQEPGYDPTGIAAARGAEIAAVVCLAAFLTGRFGLKAPMRHW
jgi:hypothetical protein